jgi:hypothetical protein
VSVTQVREITELSRPSLACLVEHPFGLTLGDIGDKATQRAVLEARLREATRPHPASTIIETSIRWERDDLRERQLHKQAH